MNRWIEAARPKTLISSVSPIFIATSFERTLSLELLLALLLQGISIQLFTNYVNDLCDHLYHRDTSLRVGPRRCCQSGLISIKEMKIGIGVLFGVGLCISFYLSLVRSPLFFFLYLVAIACGYAYSKQGSSLSTTGLADFVVLLTFGPIATGMSSYLLSDSWSLSPWIYGFGPGLFSVALLTANNLRDADEDRQTGKKTLVVRFGKTFGYLEQSICILAPLLFSPTKASLWLIPFALYLTSQIWKNKNTLSLTASLMLLYTLSILLFGSNGSFIA